jgi:hypothetical protein
LQAKPDIAAARHRYCNAMQVNRKMYHNEKNCKNL